MDAVCPTASFFASFPKFMSKIRSGIMFHGTDVKLTRNVCVYDTESGDLLYEKTVPLCWITHVQFNPVDNEIIMFNHEWPAFDCGIRRINVYDHSLQRLSPNFPPEGRRYACTVSSNNQENKPYV